MQAGSVEPASCHLAGRLKTAGCLNLLRSILEPARSALVLLSVRLIVLSLIVLWLRSSFGTPTSCLAFRFCGACSPGQSQTGELVRSCPASPLGHQIQ